MELMSPGSLLLGNLGQCFECGHDHGAGDRCLAFFYSPEFFERASLKGAFATHRIPAIADLSPLIVEARQAIDCPDEVALEELAHGLPAAVLGVLGTRRRLCSSPSAADERRISAALRFIEANLSEPLPLELLASTARMSEFHFLRTFKQVMQVTPHQYILRARLRQAAVQLKARSDKVLEIALDAGFADLSNFNQAFRTEFGLSPTRFRNKRN
jgi:AraC-like DNA-binding protein